MMGEQLVGVAEISELLGVSRQRVHQIVEEHDDFPRPVAELAAGRIWQLDDVREWIKAHPVRKAGRPPRQAG